MVDKINDLLIENHCFSIVNMKQSVFGYELEQNSVFQISHEFNFSNFYTFLDKLVTLSIIGLYIDPADDSTLIRPMTQAVLK